MKHSWDSIEQAFEKLESSRASHLENYLGFYSSWLGGYFREPWAMSVPLDDHGFHRGDGVFEAIRIHKRAFFDLNSHLFRLENSAAAIGMRLPKRLSEIQDICLQLAQRCDVDTGMLRLFVTRGPGGFSPSPSEVVGHQIYAVITQMRPLEPKMYFEGCRATKSHFPAKDRLWSQIKSCNYLQNVMMKMECQERGFDMAFSVDEHGRVCEGATENFLILSADGHLKVPRFDYTLRGTTVSLVLQLAEELIGDGLIQSAGLADITVEDVRSAKEAAFVGTTLGVLPVREIDGVKVGSGRPGLVASRLHQLLMQKMEEDTDLRTAF